MQQNGFTVAEKDQSSPDGAEALSRVPAQLQACHTAIVDGYIIEGHVPVADIERLLREKPNVTGLAVPGMPVGSPGMDVAGQPPEPYDVLAFDETGKTTIYASYR